MFVTLGWGEEQIWGQL